MGQDHLGQPRRRLLPRRLPVPRLRARRQDRPRGAVRHAARHPARRAGHEPDGLQQGRLLGLPAHRARPRHPAAEARRRARRRQVRARLLGRSAHRHRRRHARRHRGAGPRVHHHPDDSGARRRRRPQLHRRHRLARHRRQRRVPGLEPRLLHHLGQVQPRRLAPTTGSSPTSSSSGTTTPFTPRSRGTTTSPSAATTAAKSRSSPPTTAPPPSTPTTTCRSTSAPMPPSRWPCARSSSMKACTTSASSRSRPTCRSSSARTTAASSAANDFSQGERDDQFYWLDAKTGQIVPAPRGDLSLGDVVPALEGTATVTAARRHAGRSRARLRASPPTARGLHTRSRERDLRRAPGRDPRARPQGRDRARRRSWPAGTPASPTTATSWSAPWCLLLALTGNWGKPGTGTQSWAISGLDGVSFQTAQRAPRPGRRPRLPAADDRHAPHARRHGPHPHDRR